MVREMKNGARIAHAIDSVETVSQYAGSVIGARIAHAIDSVETKTDRLCLAWEARVLRMLSIALKQVECT